MVIIWSTQLGSINGKMRDANARRIRDAYLRMGEEHMHSSWCWCVMCVRRFAGADVFSRITSNQKQHHFCVTETLDAPCETCKAGKMMNPFRIRIWNSRCRKYVRFDLNYISKLHKAVTQPALTTSEIWTLFIISTFRKEMNFAKKANRIEICCVAVYMEFMTIYNSVGMILTLTQPRSSQIPCKHGTHEKSTRTKGDNPIPSGTYRISHWQQSD